MNVLKVLKHTNLCSIFADQIVRRLTPTERMLLDDPKHWAIGSDHASATLSFAVAALLGIQHEFTEKVTVDGQERQLWRRHTIQPGELVFRVEELVTTAITLRSVQQGVREGNQYPVEFTSFIFTLVHRSVETEVEGDPIKYVVHYDIETWDGPDTCPLCKAGSQRIRPKGAENWARLTRAAV